MKKIIFCSVLFLAAVPHICGFEVSDTYTHSSAFWRNNISAYAQPAYALSLGAEFDLTEHKDFYNHIYALRLPVTLSTGDDTQFALRPFYYPDNANGASAWGALAAVKMLVNSDEVENSSTNAQLSLGYAAQKADVDKNGVLARNDDFRQLAYGLLVNFNYFDIYSFDVAGTVYQYISGIDGVQNVRGVMNQAELADLGTLDYVLGLPDYSAGVKIRWVSSASRSDNYISYRYIDTYNDGGAHLLVAAVMIDTGRDFFINFAYNHIFRAGADRDLYSAGIMYKF
ncbi:MAG: hypothetical protein LBL61_05660 [Elusimicrobiota bacterium]|jgi:hypothetical protein|nr:hypothetical protein [Elusimicrobiota bacterium]